MQEVELESISKSTKGMPDCWHIDASGKSSPEVFQKHFGLARRFRNERKIVEFAMDRLARLRHFVSSILHYRNLGIAIFLEGGDKFASPEGQTFAKYDEGWHLRGEEDLVEFAKLDEDDQRMMMADMLETRRSKDWKIQQIKIQALANRANVTVDQAFEIMIKCAIESWLRARNDLANWVRLTPEDRSKLAEAIFCGFTFFGKRALEDAMAIEPEVLSHYRAFLGLSPVSVAAPAVSAVQPIIKMPTASPVEQAQPEIAAASVLPVAASPAAQAKLHSQPSSTVIVPGFVQITPLPINDTSQNAPVLGGPSQGMPQSLKELYALISTISQEAQAAQDVQPEPAIRIKCMLDQHLQRLTELNARLSIEEVLALIDHYCNAVLSMTDVLDFTNSEQRDLVPVLRAAWKATVVTALEDGRPRAWFEMNLDERQQLPEFLKRFKAEQTKIAEAAAEIDGIKFQLLEAKYTAKTSLKASETRKQNEISVANGELDTIRVEAAHCLVPDGRTLDDLVEDVTLLQEVILDVADIDASSVKSLQAMLDALKGSAPNDVVESLAATLTTVASVTVSSTAKKQLVTPKFVTSKLFSEIGEELVQAQVEQTIKVLSPESESDFALLNVQIQKTEELKSELVVDPPHTVSHPKFDMINVSEHDKEVWVNAKVTGVEEALRHFQHSESKEEAQQAFRVAYDQYSQVPSSVIESIAMHWLESGHINVAYQFLKDANDTSLVTDRVLDAAMLRSAFYGMNLWPKDREALSYTQRDLNLLNHQDLEDQLERKSSGKLVPYLLASATLQPALFSGSETQAPTLLKVAANYFDGPIQQLLSNVADFTQRGGRVDLDALRNDESQEVHLAVIRLQNQVNAWVDINAQRTTRWHSLRVALKVCSDEPIIAPAIAAIRSGDKGDGTAVRHFVNTYSSHVESRGLLDELVLRIRPDFSGQNDQIDNHAYMSFCQQIDSLVAIAQSWLLEVLPSDVRPKETKDFLEKFHTQLDRSISTLMSHPRYADLEHRAGCALLLKNLAKLQAEIKGDTHSIWKFEQTDATFRLPETLARLDISDVGVDLRLEWFATRLMSQNWLVDMIDLAERNKAHVVHLLLLSQLDSLDGQHAAVINVVNTRIAGTRAELKKTIEQFKNLSIQGMSVDVIFESDHLFNMLLADEWLDKLSTLKPFVDVARIEDEVRTRTRGLEKLLNSSAVELTEELNQALLNLRTRVGADAVPEGWEARARSALERRNLTVVRELINQLHDHINRNVRLTESSTQENVELASFLQVELELHVLLHAHPNPREAGDRVIHEHPGDFDYAIHKVEFKNTIGTLLEWRSRGQNKKPNLEKKIYEGIVSVLDFLGFSVLSKVATSEALSSCEYSTTGDFRRLKIRVERPTLPKGFPLFEGDHSASTLPLNVIFVQGAWSLAGLTDLVERHGLPDRAVLMVGEPLSAENRRSFLNFCRDRKCTIFLLDPVILSYLATAVHHQVLKTFLHVTAAWTFYNPYTKGDARLPAPPEMRFGRENDIASLVEPRGAALVYGGRQLGKTTLLNSAVQKFQQLDKTRNHAFYLRMDGLFQHAVERDTDVKTRVLEHLVNKLAEAKLLSPNSQGKPEVRLQAEFQRDGVTRVLFCLDEIDSILEKDARTNFQLVRSLVSLVNDPHQRFRVVFAGLNNVNRFRTYPNVPLEQLGSPLEVKILPSSDARSLILQPLTALGYCFEEGELVDRIMAFTNRHPSLLHIFCSELVEQMGRELVAKGGMRVIRQLDLENVENNSAVRRLSGERFDMTLNLDKRYTVVVYGLIDLYGNGIGKFTVKQALDVARNWVPEEFEQMSESGFESLLLELVGLGVLRDVDRTSRHYAMRNQSILQLIGSADDISHKLQVAVNDLANHSEDALTCHATGTNLVPSPLSLQDERQILLAKSPDGAPKYSVSMIMGTPALGLSIKGMQDSFSAINEFQSGHVLSKYETRDISEAQMLEPKRFSELLNTAIDTWALNKPAVLLVSLEQCSSIDKIMDLLGIANEKASRATPLKHPLRIVFLLGAHSMWSWHSHPWLTTSPNEIGGLVELNRWTRHACESLLDQQGLGVTADQAKLLRNATEGWYMPLLKFIEIRKKKGDSVSSFNDFTNDFTALRDLPSKEFTKFIDQTGMTSLVWSMPLAGKLQEFDMLNEFSGVDLQTAIEFLDNDFQPHISPEQSDNVVRWWTALRVIEVNTKETSTKAGKEGKVTYRFTAALQRAIAEFDSAKGTRA